MPAEIQRLADFLREHTNELNDGLCEDIGAHVTPTYSSLPPDELRSRIVRITQAWQDALDRNSVEPLATVNQQIGWERAHNRMDFNELMQVTDITRTHIWRMLGRLYAAGDWDIDLLEQVEHWLHEQRKSLFNGYNQTMQEMWSRIDEREQAMEQQRQLIRELSTPIVPIYEGVLVLPLVGAIDSYRATRVTEAVLEQIVDQQADILILDITGVDIIDTTVANYLVQMARAVRLLGAQVMIVGIGAEIAQTIVQLGVDLGGITTLANLQAAMVNALAERGVSFARAETSNL